MLHDGVNEAGDSVGAGFGEGRVAGIAEGGAGDGADGGEANAVEGGGAGGAMRVPAWWRARVGAGPVLWAGARDRVEFARTARRLRPRRRGPDGRR